jgi:hypothetical protein
LMMIKTSLKKLTNKQVAARLPNHKTHRYL